MRQAPGWATGGFLCLVGTAPLSAQPRAPDTAAIEVASLATWVSDVWLALTDRDGSYFGRLDERGTFQRFNPLMDHEYELDLVTALFTPTEDVRWAAVQRGIRVAGGSISHPFVLNLIDWRERVPISGPVHLLARYVRQRSLTQQRDYSNVGLEWSPGADPSWKLQSTIGVHFFKASADVELGASRQWRTGEQRFRLDLRVAALDAFNNVIFNALGVRPEDTPAHFNYTTLPVAGRLGAVWQAPRGHIEVHGGASNRSQVLVSFPQSGDPSYDLEDAFAFAGALVAARPVEALALAAYGTVARADAARRYTAGSGANLSVEELTRAAGLRARVGEGDAFRVEFDFRALWRPEQRTVGGDSLIQHRDREVLAQLAAVRWPPTGWIWRFAYAFLDRTAGVLAPWLTGTQHRAVTESGHRFASGFEVVAGLRWDLDDFGRAAFDGGHLRFAAAW